MNMDTLSRRLTTLGALMLVLSAVLAFSNRNAPARLLTTPTQAENHTQQVMDAMVQGELSNLGTLLYGQPQLDDAPEFENPVVSVLWNGYWESLSYTFQGGCYACDTGLRRDVAVTALDICALLPQVEAQYQALLPQRAAQAEAETAFHADGGYREDFVLSVLEEAAREAMAQQQPQKSWNLTLNLLFRDDRWWVQADAALMELLSGGMTGKGV